MKTRRKAITKTLGSLMVVALIFGMFTMIRTDVKAATLNESEFKVGTIFKVGDNVVVTSTKVCFFPNPNVRGGAHLPADTYTLDRGNLTFNPDETVNTFISDPAGEYYAIIRGSVVCGAMKATLTAEQNPDGKEISNPDGIEIIKIDTCSETPGDGTINRYVVRPHQAATVSHIEVPSAAQRPTAKTGEGTEYTGEPITLVNEPTESLPEGYKIKYALTTTETEPAESAYSDTIPTATEPGIYYIWYIIYRDKDGAETKPARLETEIVQHIDADEELHAVFGENLKIKQTKKAIKVSWGKSKNIDKFEVFIAYLGKKAGSTPTATTTANSVSVTKINNKKIDTKKNFSVEVVAYDKKGNKVGTSMKCFIAGKDNPTYTNVKSIKPAKKKITLKKGKKATINANLKLQSSSKKQLPKKYAPDIRYSSSNKKVATVNKKGKITAKGVGKCKIYMYAKNGVAKSITVTVKAK
jgi:hypothetical protein